PQNPSTSSAGPPPLSGEAFLPCEFSSTKLPRRGKQAAAAAVTLPFSLLRLGRRVSGDPPLSLLKRKKKQKKKRVRVSLVLQGQVSHEDYTKD
ncbi:hypothetical protein, partial [Ruminococcus callidus]|uniref:hypothetical protein n=1 Tax=Ruminococcus callidus TaxID=40519 RepID=UPI0023F938A8